jgi:hypothetical protein
MNDRNNRTRYTGIDRRAPRSEPAAAKPGSSLPREPFKTGGRHAAITTNLYNWHSYKSWADKVRGSWEDNKK